MSIKCARSRLALSALAGVSIASYFYYRHKGQAPRETLQDLRGNFYATGSDVCRLYDSSIPGLIVVTTGTSSGLGAQTARLFGTNGTVVIMGNRRPNDASVLELSLAIEQGGGEAISLEPDLGSFGSVRSFADEVKKLLDDRKINALIHNAGVSFLDGSTMDGYQRVWQMNALAPSLLTELLLPCICSETGRVVSISSEMHRACFGDIVYECPPVKDKGSSALEYALSKACQILQALEVSHRESTNKIRGFAIEPGLVRTNIGRHTWKLLLDLEYFFLGPFFLRTTDQGCSSTLLCVLAPMEDLGKNTFYFANCQSKTPKVNCTDLEEAKRLQCLCRDIWNPYL